MPTPDSAGFPETLKAPPFGTLILWNVERANPMRPGDVRWRREKRFDMRVLTVLALIILVTSVV
ncbi:MAG TPA: hypothetical protein VIL69_13570, partial [Roseomonas sp.]